MLEINVSTPLICPREAAESMCAAMFWVWLYNLLHNTILTEKDIESQKNKVYNAHSPT